MKHANLILYARIVNVSGNREMLMSNYTETEQNSSKKIQTRINKRGEFDLNAPLREYCETSGEFEYVDVELRQKSKFREERKRVCDVLAIKETGLKKHLERVGLKEKIGKTGDSLTGKVSYENTIVAKIQQEHAKIYIKRYMKNK